MTDALARCFARWLAYCRQRGQGLPPAPWDPAIEAFIWAGSPNAEEWCAWKPVRKVRHTDLAAAAPELPTLHASIHDYFNAWWFCLLEGAVGDDVLLLNPVLPGMEADAFLAGARGYAAAHGGRLDHVPIGLDNRSSLQVVVDNRSGAVAIEDWERGTLREIAPSLATLIDRFYL